MKKQYKVNGGIIKASSAMEAIRKYALATYAGENLLCLGRVNGMMTYRAAADHKKIFRLAE